MTKNYRYYDIVMALFVTMLLLSNLLSSAKLINTGIQLGSLQLIFDAGTLVFPISYIFGDILTEIYGFARARRVIWVGFVCNALMGFFVWLAGQLPGDAGWESFAGQNAYNAILGGISGLIVASLCAYWVGSFSNSYVLARMKVLTRGRFVWARTITSTLVGQGIDTLAFFFIAAALGAFRWPDVPALMLTNYLIKVGVEVAFTPITIFIIRHLKRLEGEDFFDYNTRFNPFRINAS